MGDTQTKIVLFSENEEHTRFLESFFNHNPQLNCSLDVSPLKIATEEIFLRYTPDFLILDFSSFSPESREYMLNKMERLSEVIPLIAVLNSDQKQEIVNYVKKGVRDVLELPFKDFEITKVVQRFRKDISKQPVKKSGRVYTFFSFKGGVGNTFVTINTAVSIAHLTKKPVLLWDMALQASDIPFFLNLEPAYTLSDLIDNIDQIDGTYLRGVLPPNAHGVSVLPAPTKIADIEKLTPAHLERILSVFSEHFDYILIDGGYRLTDPLLPLMDNSSYLLITTTLELIALRSASRCLDILESLNYPADKIKIVVNRYNSKYEALSVENAKKLLKFNLVDFIPNDYEIACKAVNLGQPILDIAPNSSLNKHFNELGKKILSHFDETKNNKRKFWIFSSKLKKAVKHAA